MSSFFELGRVPELLGKIDLHTHTWFSDGMLSPTQLVQMAKDKGLAILAITDHDGVFGLAEGEKAAARCGIRFLSGIEFSAEFSVCLPAVGVRADMGKTGGNRDGETCLDGGQRVYAHLLGYDFYPKNTALLECMEELRRNRTERNDAMCRALADLGYVLKKEDIEVYPGQPYIGKPNFARALVRAGYAASVQDAFSLMAVPSIRAIHRKKISAQRAIALIHDAGGVTALAHPFKVSGFGSWRDDLEAFMRNLEPVVARLAGLGISGIECYYSNHTQEQIQFLLGLAKKYGLFVTAGSDYHGPGIKKNVELGVIP